MAKIKAIAPCLWFDSQAEEAARFYTSVFERSKIKQVRRFGRAGFENHRRPEGTIMTVTFELDGQPFTALNGGPQLKFNGAVSLEIDCETQEEVDYFWGKLSAGGDPKAQQCGWLKDRYGVSWQVVPRLVFELIGYPDSGSSERAMTALMEMKKIDIAALKRAYQS